ncbi:Neuropeptide F receptor [Orchesella cincta]|uniref:Neuropeptide F receptor n=1 Tax=Orchesella cincta TaxID=48709 RepID=A0A1D2N3W3_ORCCI|nr:Neuropeptide F receptor [Orchesella cincta]
MIEFSENELPDQLGVMDLDLAENSSELPENYWKGVNLSILDLALHTGRHKFIERYKNNRHFDWTVLYMFIFAYGMLIVFGTIGNCLAVSAVIRKPSMRTPRNMFIINLAVSDLLLCVITMPVTLMEVVTVYWPLGNHVYLCKLFGCLQAISIFVSTISITAIALDRYHVIVYPTQASVQRVGTIFALIGIWTLACILAAPLFVWKKLHHFKVNLTEIGLEEIDYCMEEWPTKHGRAYYSIFTIIIQYAVPIVVVSVAYAQICKKLRYRMRPGGRCVETSGGIALGSRPGEARNGSIQRDRDHARVRRTNTLLISIALIFGISWMPLNAVNVIVDLFEPFDFDNENDQFYYRVLYAICHLTGMSSACSNPLLYGWLNENFRKEFREIWCGVKTCQTCGCRKDPLARGVSRRESRMEREQTTVHYRRRDCPDADGEVEQSTLITQVLDRHK